jgi:hypothetical protein
MTAQTLTHDPTKAKISSDCVNRYVSWYSGKKKEFRLEVKEAVEAPLRQVR